MKLLLFLSSIFLLISTTVHSQTSSITEMENELRTLNTGQYVNKAIEFGKQFFQNKDYKNAEYFFERAIRKIESTNQPTGIAVVHLQIYDIYQTDNNYLYFSHKKIGKDLRNLVKLTDDETVHSRIYQFATKVKNSGRNALTNKDIETVISQSANKHIAFTERIRKEEEAIKKHEEQTIIIPQKVESLEKEREQLASVVSGLRSVESRLKTTLSQNEEVIRNMNEENAIKEAILQLNRRVIDSLKYEHVIDSVINENNLVLLKNRENELKIKQTERNLFMAVAGIIFVITILLFFMFRNMKNFNRKLKDKNEIIEREKERAENLLLNILPFNVAEELKSNGKVMTQLFDHATILFTDFVNFSQIAKKISPTELINDLDYCFRNFDRIVGKYRIEKIKTIGDAYLCAAGLPEPLPNHAETVIEVAREFISFIENWNKERIKSGKVPFEIRIGIHTGKVIAGVVGSKKFVYDIWGDTVNVAARMEQYSESGRINVSQDTYYIVKDKYKFIERGSIEAKNMGEIAMYFVA